MTFAIPAQGALEYYPCRYGRSRVMFRGPCRPLDRPYLAFLGGTETYGRFIERPFPSLVEDMTGQVCINFGAVNAGLDLYLQDPTVLEAAERADMTVLQILGAQNMSNRFYSVHPRRNDRFLRASDLLQDLYPEVDFTDFHFNKHMLGHLREISEDRFSRIVEEVRTAWMARMKHILAVLGHRAILLWFAHHAPPEGETDRLDRDPLFIDRSMFDALAPRAAAAVCVTPSNEARASGTAGMIFTEFETGAAEELMGPNAHGEAADALTTTLRTIMG